MAIKLKEKERAERKAKALSDIAESFDKQGGSDPESNHRVADQIKAKAAGLIQRAERAGKIMKPIRLGYCWKRTENVGAASFRLRKDFYRQSPSKDGMIGISLSGVRWGKATIRGMK